MPKSRKRKKQSTPPTFRCPACNQKYPSHAVGCIGRIMAVHGVPVYK